MRTSIRFIPVLVGVCLALVSTNLSAQPQEGQDQEVKIRVGENFKIEADSIEYVDAEKGEGPKEDQDREVKIRVGENFKIEADSIVLIKDAEEGEGPTQARRLPAPESTSSQIIELPGGRKVLATTQKKPKFPILMDAVGIMREAGVMARVIEDSLDQSGLEGWHATLSAATPFEPRVKSQYLPGVGVVFTIPVKIPLIDRSSAQDDSAGAESEDTDDLWEKHSSATGPASEGLQASPGMGFPPGMMPGMGAGMGIIPGPTGGAFPWMRRSKTPPTESPGEPYSPVQFETLRKTLLEAIARYGYRMESLPADESILLVAETIADQAGMIMPTAVARSIIRPSQHRGGKRETDGRRTVRWSVTELSNSGEKNGGDTISLFSSGEEEAVLTFTRGDERKVAGASFRLVRVEEGNVDDPNDDTAEISMETGASISSITLRELDTQFIDEYKLTAEDVLPSKGMPGEGRARIRIRRIHNHSVAFPTYDSTLKTPAGQVYNRLNWMSTYHPPGAGTGTRDHYMIKIEKKKLEKQLTPQTLESMVEEHLY